MRFNIRRCTMLRTTFLMTIVLISTGFSLHAQEQLDEKFEKLASTFDLEYHVPKGYLGIQGDDPCYYPDGGFLQSKLFHSIKHEKYSIAIAFALVSTKPDTPQMRRLREVMGSLDKINVGVESDTALSKVKYLDTLQLETVNANRGVVFNMKMNNPYLGTYARCKKVEIYKDNIGRAEILFFYNKGEDDLVDEEIKRTWGMLKFE